MAPPTRPKGKRDVTETKFGGPLPTGLACADWVGTSLVGTAELNIAGCTTFRQSPSSARTMPALSLRSLPWPAEERVPRRRPGRLERAPWSTRPKVPDAKETERKRAGRANLPAAPPHASNRPRGR